MKLDHLNDAHAADPPAALRAALVVAIARRRRRVRFRSALAGGTGIGVAAIALAVGLLARGPSPALAIDSDAGPWVEVRIENGQAGADEMTSELQAAGINAEVKLIPAGPDFVGRWMGFLRTDPPLLQPGEAPTVPSHPCLLAAPPPLLASHQGYVDGDLLAIRRDTELSDARWAFYLGREPQGSERPEIVSAAGPTPIDPNCGTPSDGPPVPGGNR
jgi:hypothetical protein